MAIMRRGQDHFIVQPGSELPGKVRVRLSPAIPSHSKMGTGNTPCDSASNGPRIGCLDAAGARPAAFCFGVTTGRGRGDGPRSRISPWERTR